MTTTLRHLVAGFAILMVVAGIAGGLMILGPPSVERSNRLDRKRVEDLEGIKGAVDLYQVRNRRPPASLDELAREAGTGITTRDPGTTAIYEYRSLGERKVELCAVFERESTELSMPGGAGFWSHGPGRKCFQDDLPALPPN